LKIDLPAVVDGMDNHTERAYTAWPDRLVVIDKNGRVAYKSRPGPFGFQPGDMEAVLRRIL
jgi:type I thyroxine 5'-deiodinase